MLYNAVKKRKRKKSLMCFPCLKKKKSEGVSTFLFSSSFKSWPPLSWGKDSPPSCPICWDEWFPTSAFNTIGKSLVTESSQDFSGVSSSYCKNMNIRGLFCAKNHDEENRRRKGKRKSHLLRAFHMRPSIEFLDPLINHTHSALKYYNITRFVN